MSAVEYELAEPPREPEALRLWVQNVAGFILMEDVASYARDRLPDVMSDETRAIAEQAIADALYGVMMVAEGVSGSIEKPGLPARVAVSVRLQERRDGPPDREEGLVFALDLADGDGMCTGYHGWMEGDYGEEQILMPKE